MTTDSPAEGVDFKSYKTKTGLSIRKPIPRSERVLIKENIDLKKDNVDLVDASTTDVLTGLMNRRGFDQIMELSMHKSDRDFAIFMIDIDNFKTFNDGFGHAKGDEVLINVANELKLDTRTGDVLARYGGDEFIVLVPRPPKEDIELKKIADRYVGRFKENEDGVGISIGVTRYYNSLDMGKWQQTKERADQALYQAKHRGRNKSEFINFFEAGSPT